MFFFKQKLNASKPSEHPTQGGKCQNAWVGSQAAKTSQNLLTIGTKSAGFVGAGAVHQERPRKGFPRPEYHDSWKVLRKNILPPSFSLVLSFKDYITASEFVDIMMSFIDGDTNIQSLLRSAEKEWGLSSLPFEQVGSWYRSIRGNKGFGFKWSRCSRGALFRG